MELFLWLLHSLVINKVALSAFIFMAPTSCLYDFMLSFGYYWTTEILCYAI